MSEALALDRAFAHRDPLARMALLRRSLVGRIVFTTSFGIEDQYLTHLIAQNGLDIEIATLDTGRLFPETYKVWAQTEQRYGRRIKAFYPQAEHLQRLVEAQGIDGFYESVDARKRCCEARKIEPLKRALAGADAWIAGLRADQSDHRGGGAFVTRDETFGLLKASPLFDWSRADVAAAVAAAGAPINELHDAGFPSIGCAPCTRAVAPGDDERAGRWWWESSEKECGLHIGADGRLARVKG
ncbi:MAG: phosphoadenylyl-sulfate reductase [Hyphomicrobiales bacterium]|nr:phosphoadenylyl-sulfate reductase [Hyphomicrobiales bacterium]